MSNTTCYLIDSNTGLLTDQTIPCNNVVGSPNFIDGKVYYDHYGYNVSEWSALTFLIAFAVLTAIHILQGAYFRSWYTFATFCIGGIGETMGWLGRYLSWRDTFWQINGGGGWFISGGDWFILQICCLIISPVFFSAANYIILGHLLARAGNVHCSITGASFETLFIFADFICLVVQGIGGGLAGTASTLDNANRGGYIMTGGVIAQLVVTLCYTVLAVEFAWRYYNDRPVQRQIDLITKMRLNKLKCWGRRKESAMGMAEKQSRNSSAIAVPQSLTSRNKVTLYLFMLFITTLLIVIRSIFRTAELLRGWNGPLATNQTLFIALDAVLMLAYLVAWALVHPGFFDGRRLF